jgi:hypothetical protein
MDHTGDFWWRQYGWRGLDSTGAPHQPWQIWWEGYWKGEQVTVNHIVLIWVR